MNTKPASRLTVVSECCKLLSQATDSTKTLQLVCKTLAETFRALFCAITSFDLTEQRLVIRASHGLYVEELQSIAPDHSLSSIAFHKQQILNRAPDIRKIPPEHFTCGQLAKRCHSLLALPLIVQGHSVGILTLGRSSKLPFPQSVVDICNVLATPIASFLQNVELLKQANQPIREEKPEGPACAGRFFSGKSIAPGVCLGRCLVLASDDALRTVSLTKTTDIAAERARLRQAYEQARQSLAQTRPEVAEVLAEADLSIFDMYEILLEDPTLQERIESKLAQGYELNSALGLTLQEVEADLNHLADDYLRERIRDIEDVLLRLLNAANNQAPRTASDLLEGSPIVLVARELFPSQLLASPLKHVRGIVCESGGVTSHATILARALRIPMVIGIKDIQNIMHPGDQFLVDGTTGLCFPEPSQELLRQYKATLARAPEPRDGSASKEDAPPPVDDMPCTQDGTPIHLCGNITLFAEMSALHAAGAREVGLYRTEFMFVIRNAMPDEETQYRVISRLVKDANGAPVSIRALDIGGDKPLPYIKWDDELNPSLGLRGLRFLLSNPDILRTQLRAILRASLDADVTLTFPMVADLMDLQEAKKAVAEAKRSLQLDQVPYGNPKIGMMLELPSAFFCLEQLLPEVDSVSIGTNDLVQYLFGVDRGNSHVTKWFRHNHPIVFRLLGEICSTVAKYPEKTVQLWGELAGSRLCTPLLLGAGLRRLSMNPSILPSIRERIRGLKLSDCEKLYNEACKKGDAKAVYDLAKKFVVRQKREQ